MGWQEESVPVKRGLVRKIEQMLEIFRSAKRWTKYYMALDKDGAQVSCCSVWAKCWCLHGAINNVVGLGGCVNIKIQTVQVVQEAILQLHLMARSVSSFNDHRGITIKDVRAVLRLAKKNILATL